MRGYLTIAAVTFLAVMLLPGCVMYGISETARTAPPGEFQFTGTVTAVHAQFEPVDAQLFVIPEVKAKFGVAPMIDVGLDLALGPGAGLNMKFQPVAGPVDVALHLSGSIYDISSMWDPEYVEESYTMYNLSPRLILSGDDTQGPSFCVHLGTEYSGQTASDEYSEPTGLWNGVVGLGLPFRVGSSGAVRVMPELVVRIPFADEELGGETGFLPAGTVGRLGVSFSYVGAAEEESGGLWAP
jgi:hypothetical protein